jgi:uncharacterized protein (DUF427 family)
MWEYRGQKRPSFAEKPGPGQQSVWDYPRPPAIEVCTRVVEVRNNSVEVARSVRACRVLETASPPAFYIPPQDVDWSKLAQAPGSSICEWKGIASYWALSSNPVRGVVAWSYAEPRARFKSICNYVSFYPALLACYVDGERVRPQPGKFYGGWVTNEIVGPFKGESGTELW